MVSSCFCEMEHEIANVLFISSLLSLSLYARQVLPGVASAAAAAAAHPVTRWDLHTSEGPAPTSTAGAATVNQYQGHFTSSWPGSKQPCYSFWGKLGVHSWHSSKLADVLPQ